MELYLVRHAETDWNVEDRIQGHTDISLNEHGRKQAERCRDDLKGIAFTHVYTSPLRRAVETAQILVGQEYPLQKCSEFAERDFGNWESCLWKDKQADLEKQQAANGIKWRPNGGESLEEMIMRAQCKFQEIVRGHAEDDRILIVSHGGPMKAILAFAMQLPHERVPDLITLGNCCINKIMYFQGRFDACYLNREQT